MLNRGRAVILGGRARLGRPPEITGTRRGRCAARKVELTGGPGWQRGEGATRAWALVVRGERACCWAEEERGRVREWAELGGSRAAVRGKRVGRAGVSEGKEVSWAAGWFVELGWSLGRDGLGFGLLF